MMPAPSLGTEQCNLIGRSMRANIDSLKNETPAHLLADKTTTLFAGLIHAIGRMADQVGKVFKDQSKPNHLTKLTTLYISLSLTTILLGQFLCDVSSLLNWHPAHQRRERRRAPIDGAVHFRVGAGQGGAAAGPVAGTNEFCLAEYSPFQLIFNRANTG